MYVINGNIVQVARQNVARNGLSERVEVVKTAVDGAIIEVFFV